MPMPTDPPVVVVITVPPTPTFNIPVVEIPETLILCAVKLVTVVTPKVLTPAVTTRPPASTLTPDLAVTNPIESTLVTSS